jgi:glutamine amidotransferase
MRVAIVDYQSGNLHSALKAFQRAARDNDIAADIACTADPDAIRAADRIVLPGVGAFADCYRGLAAAHGVMDALQETVHGKGRPFLGICVGLQLLAERGLEHGEHRGLGWLPGVVQQIEPKAQDPSHPLKIPHMGWNTLTLRQRHPLFDGIPDGPSGWHAYFVHSYHFGPEEASSVVATADYGGHITAAVAKENIAGTQFHPEKSQALGLTLIANFLRWRP